MLKSNSGDADNSILITGLGSIGGGGRNSGELWENCYQGRVTAHKMAIGDLLLSVYCAPEPNLTPSDAHLVRKAGRAATLALAAAREAWQDAQLDAGNCDPARIGIVIGSSRGPADVVDASLARKSKRPSESIYAAFSSTAGLLASALDIRGCCLSVSATCTSGASAIYTAAQLLRSGDFDIILAGGVDAPLIPSILEQLSATGILSSLESRHALRPFDIAREGTVLGEGAGFVVLESAASASRRGVPSRGTLLGAALSTESRSRSRPSDQGEGLQHAIKTALSKGPTELSSVPDLVHVHGTGTKINDQMESSCLQALFGPPDSQPIAWASKGITGHTLGAASAFQAVLTLLAMKHSYLPGTTNCSVQDPSCNIRLSLGKGSSQPIRTALCITSGFWGKSSCLYFGAPA